MTLGNLQSITGPPRPTRPEAQPSNAVLNLAGLRPGHAPQAGAWPDGTEWVSGEKAGEGAERAP
jgi:hypothetical protein